MMTHSIPAFYRSLSQKFQGIDPYVSTWDDIKIEQLLSIEVFLNESIEAFQEMVIIDKMNGYAASSIIISVHRTLKTFMAWAESLPTEYINHTSESDTKEARLREIALVIEFLWLTWLITEYEPVMKEANANLVVLPIEERTKIAKEHKEESSLDERREKLFECIIGASPKEREIIFNTLASVVSGKGGKDLAPYLKAAIELNLLSRTPDFPSMKTFWGITKTQPALSRYLSFDDCSCSEKIIEEKKKEIMYALSSKY